MITIVNYGLGNIQAFVNIYKGLNIPTKVAETAEQLADATRIILPGVGAFDWAMGKLDASGMRDTLDDLVLGRGVPVLGVCVGMQMMAKTSEEGTRTGLGWLDASVRRFDTAQIKAKTHLPHMGWNDMLPVAQSKLFDALDAPRFYFLHSYYFEPVSAEITLAETDYFGRFCCVVGKDHIFGTQFHPEKSHGWGIRLLRNFARK